MPDRADDLKLLELLHARDALGLTGAALSRYMGQLTGERWSSGRIAGALNRVRKDRLPCACAMPENRDGGMPPRWWDRGALS